MYKYVDPTATAAGEFTDGDPSLGIARTVLRAKWLNMMARESLNLLAEAGIEPNESDETQIFQAIRVLSRKFGTPIGTVSGTYDSAAPEFWVAGIGGLFLRADYPELYAHAVSKGLVVSDATWATGNNRSFFSHGDGSTTFRAPDLRGEFMRFWDAGRGIDPGRALGSWQAGELEGHRHFIAAPGATDSALASDKRVAAYKLGTDEGYSLKGATAEASLGQTSATGGGETRPRSVALLPIIKAF